MLPINLGDITCQAHISRPSLFENHRSCPWNKKAGHGLRGVGLSHWSQKASPKSQECCVLAPLLSAGTGSIFLAKAVAYYWTVLHGHSESLFWQNSLLSSHIFTYLRNVGTLTLYMIAWQKRGSVRGFTTDQPRGSREQKGREAGGWGGQWQGISREERERRPRGTGIIPPAAFLRMGNPTG